MPYCLLCSIRRITAEVGAAVVRAAVEEDLAEGHGDVGSRELEHMSKVCFLARVNAILLIKNMASKIQTLF